MTQEENYAAIMSAWMNPDPQPGYHRPCLSNNDKTW